MEAKKKSSVIRLEIVEHRTDKYILSLRASIYNNLQDAFSFIFYGFNNFFFSTHQVSFPKGTPAYSHFQSLSITFEEGKSSKVGQL